MRDKDRDKLRLTHIVEACDRIKGYYPNGEIPLLNDKSIEFFGLVKNLEIIGEAAYMLTKDFVADHPETEWSEIIHMRHLMVHGYYRISPKIVKEIVETEIDKLRRQVDNYIEEFHDS